MSICKPVKTLMTFLSFTLAFGLATGLAQSGKTNPAAPAPRIQAAAQDNDVHPREMTAAERQLAAELAKTQSAQSGSNAVQLAKSRSGGQALQSATSVLIIWDIITDGTQALKSALESAGMTVTLSATREDSYDGTNPAPCAFDAVIHLNGTTFEDEMPVAGQNALAAYVQAGGGFLSSEWNAYQVGRGQMTAMRDLILFDRVSGSGGTITVTETAAQAGHPILANVPSSFSFNSSYNTGYIHPFSTNPATVLMTDQQGNDAVAVREFGAGRIVGFHHAGNYAGLTTLFDANVQQLFIDGVLWAMGSSSGCNQPPTADAGPDQVVWGPSGSADVTLDGSGSSDPDSDPLTYTWKEGATTIATGVNPTVSLSVGTHTLELTVDDGNGGTDMDEVVITVKSNKDILGEQSDAVQALIDDSQTPEDAIDPLGDAKEALGEACDFAEEGEIKDMLDAMRDAAEALEEAREEHADTDAIASTLADLARLIATEKRDEAFDCDSNPTGKMADDMEDGDNDLSDGDEEYNDPDGPYFGDAIKDYCKAWEDYCDALDRCDAPKTVSSDQASVTSDQTLPQAFALHQNYPNPFNPTTTIQFDLIDAGTVSLSIYNSAGQLVRTLASGDYAPGAHRVTWDARDDSGARVASGLYLYTIKVGQQFTAQKKLLLMK